MTVRLAALAAALTLSLSSTACTSLLPTPAQQQPGATRAGAPAANGKHPDVQQLLDQATARAKSAKSLALSGAIKDKGDTINISIEGLTDGTNQRVDLTQGGQKVNLIVAGGKTWVSPLDAATAQTMGMEASAVGKFMEVPPDQAADFNEIKLSTLLTQLTSPEGLNMLQKANVQFEDVTEQGRKAWRLTQRVGDQAEIIIAADGKPDILKFSSPEEGTVSFSKWDAAQTFAAPPKDKIFVP